MTRPNAECVIKNAGVSSGMLYYHVSSQLIFFVANLQTPMPIRELDVFVSKMVMIMKHVCVFECALEREF